MQNVIISACLLGIPCRYDGKSKQIFTNEQIKALKAKFNLIPVCPEIYGGLPTPRTGSERVDTRVIMKDATDVTQNFEKGASITLDLCRILGARMAILKEKSPSCGKGKIYDGTFSGTLKDGFGVTAELLLKNGITVYTESEIIGII